MALIIADIHGNLDKAQKFLAFKPEETHIFVGDYVDSFHEDEDRIIATLKECIESDAILVLGNHDLHYFSEPPFTSSGLRYHMKNELNKIFEANISRFVPCIVSDGFIVTHGGISEGYGNSVLKTTDINKIAKKITDQWDQYLATRFLRKPSMPRIHNPLFNISFSRGGRDSFAGPFWSDYRDDILYGVPQIFGHSKTPIGNIVNIGKKNRFWVVGCDNDRRICFNSTTKEVEDFGEKEAAS